ncbi:MULTISPECIES: murein biosynthesis integral membrane protein MurJ [Aminobacter]|jgi:putative peptidoglycan lipid II flippase|uniref:Probable lipid II flippase MurJ n=2 Tax=Aminobacter TaxID=31988 RepID=A0AAC8YJJ8_AMIAI|nr:MULTISPECIES: murein biosynthesis integral membrane protein MurJ [Aminobacter]AMS39487.1 multidrug transporter MurJ [Aminobacter aminovorans]MBA8909405.1 putative peptidoglycan lipid II flippase [Aminobacter ciceronei]MBA9023104.1 putative peptidoglycan lipid II flippase [Aminobacter ciceronei]MBB3707634.1 putative peptidoglycan lipid II flippase [Aminobacter aminovorans]MRX34675.1 murein biosynthesis integral membrane protein MurJ [Aminobacter sp. MDW-2]
MSLIKKFATVASGTLMSRVLGFAREMLMAAALGTGPVADAFYAAFQFPNTFRRLFAEGAFNAAFVPLFAKEIEANGTEGAKRFSEEVFGVLFSALLVLTIAMELAMPLIVRFVVAPGFADNPEKYDLTVALATIMFPYLICMSLAAMMSGMLNSLRRYFAAAIAPVFLNIILVGVLANAWYRGHDGLTVGYALAWGVLAAGLVQLIIVWIAVRHAGISIGFRRPRLTPNVKRLLWLALPAAITGGITQINTLIGTAIASGQDSAVSSLNLADRVYQLPLGVVGVAVAIVLLPELSRALKAGNKVEAANLQNRSVEFTLFLTLPAAAALLVMSEPIVRVLYERGAFAASNSTPVVASILAIFGLGLPAFVLIKAFTPGFFAREDTRTPMYFAAISVAVNISVALTLFPSWGAPGIAAASAIAGWVNAAMLLGTLVWRGQWDRDAALMKRIPRLVVASAIMAGGLWFATGEADQWLGSAAPVYTQAAALGVLVAAAMIIYFSVAFGIGGADARMIRRNIKRNRAKPAPTPAESE